MVLVLLIHICSSVDIAIGAGGVILCQDWLMVWLARGSSVRGGFGEGFLQGETWGG